MYASKLSGLAIPFHSHVGLNYVISDYVPKAHRFAARSGLLMATVITMAGIFKLNFDGPGLTGTLKSLWMKPEDVRKKWSKLRFLAFSHSLFDVCSQMLEIRGLDYYGVDCSLPCHINNVLITVHLLKRSNRDIIILLVDFPALNIIFSLRQSITRHWLLYVSCVKRQTSSQCQHRSFVSFIKWNDNIKRSLTSFMENSRL